MPYTAQFVLNSERGKETQSGKRVFFFGGRINLIFLLLLLLLLVLKKEWQEKELERSTAAASRCLSFTPRLFLPSFPPLAHGLSQCLTTFSVQA